MPVVDLTSQSGSLPDTFIVDTNILIEQILGLFPGIYPSLQPNVQRSHDVFRWLASGTRTGVVTPTIFHELIHFAIKSRYKLERVTNRTSLVARFGRLPDWTTLYKADPSILRLFQSDLDGLCRNFVAAGLLIESPRDAGRVLGAFGYDALLIDRVCRYGLDSNDAAILLEASSLGITDIVTLDKDLLRAQSDFTIYTWL